MLPAPVGAALGIDPADPPANVAAVAAERLAAIEPGLEDDLPGLLSVLDVPADDPAWLRFDPPQQRQLAVDAARRLVLHLTGDGPLLILVEDLHWIDAGSRELLDALTADLAGTTALVLASARPGGTPLFIEETVRALVEAGFLAGAPGALRVTGQVESIDIPASVQGVIAARIDRLDGGARAVLQAAAVFGTTVSAAALDAVAAAASDETSTHVTTLLGASLLNEVRTVPRTFGFLHALVRDVAYASLTRDRLRALHARAGAALETLGGVEAPPAVVAEHHRRGEQWERAGSVALLAAREALERYEQGEALALTGLALECADRAGRQHALAAEALALAGDVHGLAGDVELANASYDRALALGPEEALATRVRHRYHHLHELERDGVRLAYAVNGDGAETVVFLIPVAYDLSMFQPTIAMLCDRFRLVTVEPRGNGRSSPIADGFTFSDWVDDVAAVVEHLDAGPVHVVGQSRGAAISLRRAERRPELVASQILIGLKCGLASYGAWLAEFESELARGDVARLAHALTMQAFSEPEATDLVRKHIRAMCAIPVETVQWFFRILPDFDASEVAPRVASRSPVVHGTEDRNTPVSDGMKVARLLPDAEFRPFPGRGHVPNFTARAEFCEVVTAFVRGEPVPGVVDVSG